MTDYTVPTVPWTIQLRPSHLVAMLLAVVVITAALTWSLVDMALETGRETRDTAATVATQHDLHAAYAGIYADRAVPVSTDHALAAATLAAGIAPAALPTSASAPFLDPAELGFITGRTAPPAAQPLLDPVEMEWLTGRGQS